MNRWNAHGFSLMEILTATAIAVVVILAIGQVDVSRVRLSEEARRRSNVQGEAALALADMARLLQSADRIELLSPTSIQFRRFIGDSTVPGALDVAANYRWAQYKLVDVNPADGTMDTIRFYDDTAGGCGVDDSFATTNLLTIQYQHEAPPPPGGDPFSPSPDDNNVLQFTIDGRYTTEVTIRAGAYTNIVTGLTPAEPNEPPTPPC